MISIQRILGREDKFYTLLEKSAEEALASVRVLVKYLQDPFQLKNLTEFVHPRRKEKAIATQISDELCTTFVTSLEREDIESLSTSLYKIPKTVEKIAERLMLAPHFLKSVNLARHMALMIQATETLHSMVEGLRLGFHLERIHDLNEKLQAIEGEADKVLLESLRELYTVNTDAVRAVFLKDILELMEKVFDRCRDAGNVINHIVLKNS
jgi:uncharacterized protein